jgi:hypothetical protein
MEEISKINKQQIFFVISAIKVVGVMSSQECLYPFMVRCLEGLDLKLNSSFSRNSTIIFSYFFSRGCSQTPLRFFVVFIFFFINFMPSLKIVSPLPILKCHRKTHIAT